MSLCVCDCCVARPIHWGRGIPGVDRQKISVSTLSQM